jgi:phosphinothricin acetyltransferase
MKLPLLVRLAEPERDAAAVAEIYGPAVEPGVASFEAQPPGRAEMAERMRKVMARTPWLVAEHDGVVIGYTYAGPHRDRAGYRWSVDISVYVDPRHQGRGVGRQLYAALLDRLRFQGFVNAYAGVTLPNAASVALHEAIGMRRIGVYPRIGFKRGQWHDVAWYWLRLSEPDGIPAEPIALPDLAAGDAADRLVTAAEVST